MLTLDVSNAEVARYHAEVSAYKARAEKANIEMSVYYGMTKPLVYGAPPVPAAPKKCTSCGSQEFTLRGARHVCSYCRQ